MELYILRHGIAADRDAGEYPNDDLRPLTDEGIARMREEAEGMAALGLEFDRILTSPLRRARQTADAVARVLGAADRLQEVDQLGHGFSCPAVCALLSDLAPEKSFLLVGHQPDLGELASYLLAGSTAIDVPLKKGGLLLIETPARPAAGSGALVWLLAPKHLRMIGERQK